MQVIKQADLPGSELVGEDHGGLGVSVILIDAPPESGPRLHKHAYEELFIVQEGEATFTAGDDVRVVRAGNIVVVPPDTPHKFVNSGNVPLRQIAIHVSSRFVTEWLE